MDIQLAHRRRVVADGLAVECPCCGMERTRAAPPCQHCGSDRPAGGGGGQ